MKKIKHICKICGKEFYSNSEQSIYCSKDCANKGMTTKVTKICEYCGKEFKVFNSLNDIQKFCSRECYEASRKPVEKICPICHKMFTPKHTKQIYCGVECRNKSYATKETCVCEYCGKEFERKKSEVDKSKHHYCSIECKYNAIKWNQDDIRILEENYGKINNKELQNMLSEKHSVKEISRKAIKLGVAGSPFWTNDEINILIENFPKIPFSEVQKLLPGRTKNSILGKAHCYNLTSYFYNNRIYSKDDIDFLTKNYLTMSNSELAESMGRTTEAISLKLGVLGLTRPAEEKNSSYTGLAQFVRRRIRPWVKETQGYFKNKCCLSGKNENTVIHHVRSFNLLLEETIDNLNFPEYKDFNDYSEDELESFILSFIDLQEYYHAYVCITEDIHKLFHSLYGYGDNTQEQWDEFVENYNNHCYDNVA